MQVEKHKAKENYPSFEKGKSNSSRHRELILNKKQNFIASIYYKCHVMNNIENYTENFLNLYFSKAYSQNKIRKHT